MTGVRSLRCGGREKNARAKKQKPNRAFVSSHEVVEEREEREEGRFHSAEMKPNLEEPAPSTAHRKEALPPISRVKSVCANGANGGHRVPGTCVAAGTARRNLTLETAVALGN